MPLYAKKNKKNFLYLRMVCAETKITLVFLATKRYTAYCILQWSVCSFNHGFNWVIMFVYCNACLLACTLAVSFVLFYAAIYSQRSFVLGIIIIAIWVASDVCLFACNFFFCCCSFIPQYLLLFCLVATQFCCNNMQVTSGMLRKLNFKSSQKEQKKKKRRKKLKWKLS